MLPARKTHVSLQVKRAKVRPALAGRLAATDDIDLPGFRMLPPRQPVNFMTKGLGNLAIQNEALAIMDDYGGGLGKSCQPPNSISSPSSTESHVPSPEPQPGKKAEPTAALDLQKKAAVNPSGCAGIIMDMRQKIRATKAQVPKAPKGKKVTPPRMKHVKKTCCKVVAGTASAKKLHKPAPTPAHSSQERSPKYPGIPSKAVAPLVCGDFKVYSDLKSCQWRMKKVGDRKDRSASWKTDGKAAWLKVCRILNGQKV